MLGKHWFWAIIKNEHHSITNTQRQLVQCLMMAISHMVVGHAAYHSQWQWWTIIRVTTLWRPPGGAFHGSSFVDGHWPYATLWLDAEWCWNWGNPTRTTWYGSKSLGMKVIVVTWNPSGWSILIEQELRMSLEMHNTPAARFQHFSKPTQAATRTCSDNLSKHMES